MFITHSISEAVFLSTRVLVMSARPGRIVGDFTVPFAYPRPPELRFDAEFAELCGEVSHALRGAHAVSLIGTDAPANVGMSAEPAEAIVAESLSETKRKDDRFPWSRVIGPLLVFAVFVAFWHLMHTDGMRRIFDKPGFLIPAPETVLHDSFVDSIARSALLNGIKWTTLVALFGLAITIVIGIVLAVFMAQAKWIESSTYPYLVTIQAIPILAIVPVIYSMFGGGMYPRVIVVRDDLDLPDRDEHVVRPAVGRSGPARPVHAARRESLDPAVEAAVPRGAAEHLHRLPHLGRPVGDRCGRRRAVLPRRQQAGHRHRASRAIGRRASTRSCGAASSWPPRSASSSSSSSAG